MDTSPTPSLRIETNDLDGPDISTLQRAPVLKAFPSAHMSTSPSDERPSMDLGRSASKDKKKQDESRKLLAHVLAQLQVRPMPPTIYDSYRNSEGIAQGSNLGAVIDTVKDVMRRTGSSVVKTHSRGTLVEDDSDDDARLAYSTDSTYELIYQVRSIFRVAWTQKWEIFDDDTTQGRSDAENSKVSYPFRRSRSSFQGSRSHSPSPVRESRIHASELFLQCVSVLASVIQEECRYTLVARPLRPSHALHAACLDIAQFLVNARRQDPQLVSHVTQAVIPAFSIFPKEMHGRLLKFFEECIVWRIMEDLRICQTGSTQKSLEDPARMVIEGEGKAPVTIQIHGVEQAIEDEWELREPIRHSVSPGFVIPSAYAPMQSRSIYHLSSVFPPLLSAILENVDITRNEPRPEVHERLRRVLLSISEQKFDTCLDFLQVIAYNTPRARLSACTVVTALWPKAVGHITVCEPLADVELMHGNSVAFDYPQSHLFVPWRFLQGSKAESGRTRCHVCTSQIIDFGLMCHLCMCSIHFDCYDYPQGCSLVQCSTAASHEAQKLALYRFCYAPLDDPVPRAQEKGHDFRSLNFFTLCPCSHCGKPMWGCFLQGVGCTSCSTFFHLPCFSSAVSNLRSCKVRVVELSELTVSRESLRDTCIDYYKEIPLVSQDDPQHLSYEEVSIYLGLVWIQLQLLNNGIALGTIVIAQKGQTVAQIPQLIEFELHHAVQYYQTLLESKDPKSSQAMEDYLFENRLHRHEHNLMFDWSCLAFISTAIRGSFSAFEQGSPGFLSVSPSEPVAQSLSSEDSFHNVASSRHTRGALEYIFNVASESASGRFLQYLSLLGFLKVLNNPNGPTDDNQQLYCFILPSIFDSSVEVEILISAVEACLSDEYLSVNEFGFLLLIRKLSPNGMSTEYALRRLARSVIAWILTEDSAVGTILREFVAKRHLPGIPMSGVLSAWPGGAGSRAGVNSSMNGGNYVALRRTLHSRYASTWLLTLHDQDPVLYAEVIYDACADFASVETFNAQGVSTLPPGKHGSSVNEHILLCIAKLWKASVVYNSFDKLILRWMESVSMAKSQEPMAAMHKLFNLQRNSSMRFSVSSDSAMTAVDDTEPMAVDPWQSILVVASRRGDDLTRSLDWLNLLASGGVQIPAPHFLRMVDLVSEGGKLPDAISIVNAAFKNVWLNPITRQDIPAVLSRLHVHFSSTVISSMQSSQGIDNALRLIRQSLASCLLVFGCNRKKVTEMGMILDAEIQGLPLRRKANNREASPGDPITIDAGMMDAIELYIDIKNEETSCFIAKFLNAFLTDSPFMEAYEVDNFVLRNGKLLAKSAWQFYDIQRADLYEVRAGLLARIIVVDPQPFHDICHESLAPTASWEGRLSAVMRLFRIIQDVTSPVFEIQGRHWRSSITTVLHFYLKTLWTDDQEAVRLAVKTAASTLRPTHLQAMQSCWIEHLTLAPITERVRLVSFLYQVLSYFPHWKVLSWRAIVDVLAECEYHHDSLGECDRDMVTLRVALLLTSLQMIANGAAAPITTLLKIKKHLADLIGFSNVTPILQLDGQISRIEFGEIDAISDDAVPCIGELVAVLDSPTPFDLTPSMMTAVHGDDKPSKLLVGSLFVDIILEMFCTLRDLSSLPILTLKRVLESLCIMVYKHKFETPPLLHLQHRLRQAASRSLELVLQDITYESRQIALSFIQVFVKQCGNFMGALVYKAIEALSIFITTQNSHASDALTAQARSFLGETLFTYGSNGLFANLLKRPLPRDFFLVLREIFISGLGDTQATSKELKTAFLHDAMTRAIEFDYDAFQTTLQNLSTYIEIVHHEEYTSECMLFVGQQFINLARKGSSSENVDLSPLFLMPAILCENNKGRIRDILPYIENEIRIILTRTSVTFASIFRLLCATQSLQRRNGSLVFANSLAPVIFEILMDGLKSKARVQPSSLTTLIQVVMHDDNSEWLPLVVTYPNLFLGLVDNSVHFLLTYDWPESKLEDAFNSSLSAARSIWRAIDDDARMTEKLAELGSEKYVSTAYRIRAWNVMVLTALQYSDKRRAAILFPFLGMFSNVQFHALRTYVQTEPTYWSPETANINHAYISMKLWILVAGRMAADSAEGELAINRVWNELWPPFEALAFNVEKQSNSHATLALLISSSVADLFTLLHSLRTPLGLQTAMHISTLERLQNITGIDAASRKISRAISALSQVPSPQPFDLLVDQASKDIVAAEKLRVLESKKDTGRGLPEKRTAERPRRDVRVPT